MSVSGCRVYNIAPGGDFLHVLAREILLGFPFAQNQREKPPLPNWTILLPTRRAARILGSILAENCGQNSLLLPSINPIGDIDDGRLKDVGAAVDIPAAISKTGQLFMMLDILKNWATQNPQAKIAAEIQASQLQSLGLADSLLQLVDQMETGETNLDMLAEAYHVELSDHRTALVNLLGLLKIELPRRLLQENLMGPAARRSLLIRLEAKRISHSKLSGPIIAAGSTGTIPATRALLTAITNHPNGSVVLPGLDLEMHDEDWTSIGFDHPQFSLQTLIKEMKVERRDIIAISAGNQNRNLMSRELMRPSSSAEKWHVILPRHNAEMNAAIEKLHLVNAPDRHIEARAIALIMRHALETPNQTAALVTPDRDLAQRVKSELLRWDIVIDDSAGEPLNHYGLAALATLVLRALESGLNSADLLALLSHADCSLGMVRQEFNKNRRLLEIVVLRGYSSGTGFDAVKQSLTRALEAKRNKSHMHPLVSHMSDDDWLGLQKFVENITNIFTPLLQSNIDSGQEHLANFESILKQLAPNADWTKPENQSFYAVLEDLYDQTFRLQRGNFSAVSPLIHHVLREETFQFARQTHPRLAIYGVLEARLVPCDILVMGGLNEGRWPAQPDTGPWLNRPMRTLFGMPLPERDIGVSAHDFTQGLGYAKVYLTCSKRLDGAPQIPSRWLLRMQTIIQAAGLAAEVVIENSWIDLAQALDASPTQVPHEKPKPHPPVAARPTRFSVTDVEKLIRDPYSIYAKKILKIEPLSELARTADAALRGTLYHEALKIWNQQQAHSISEDSQNLLLQIGERLFEPLRGDPEISAFWWSRFTRIAAWVAALEPSFRETLTKVHAEISGNIEFNISDTSYKLSAKADRIDILKDGTARIIDYKSGTPPTEKTVRSGISPQLPLEAAILLAEGFSPLTSTSISEMFYIHISGSKAGGNVIEISVDEKLTLDQLAKMHLAGFKSLLEKYQNSTQAYLPRVATQKEDDKTDYDHLSRHKEWMMAGEA